MKEKLRMMKKSGKGKREEMREPKIRRRLFSLLMAVILCFTMMPTMAFADETDESKTLTVGSGSSADYTTIQEAIDAIYATDDKDGWTIKVEDGTYDRFIVTSGVDNLTVVGQGDTTVIQTMVGTEKQYNTDPNGIVVNGGNFTLKDVKITIGTTTVATQATWKSSAIFLPSGGGANGCTIESVTIEGSGIDAYSVGGYAVFVDNKTDTFTIKDCKISGCPQAIYMENTASGPEAIEITNTTFENCSFAFHGSWASTTSSGSGTFDFTNNKIIGSSSLRNKVVIQDTSDLNTTTVTIQDNELVYALIGTVNLKDTDECNDVLNENTFNDSSFYVDAIEPGTIDVYATYLAPDEEGYWVLTGIENSELISNNKDVDADILTYIQQAINEANRTGSRELTITGIDEDNLIRTFTWCKDGIYWVSGEYGKVSYPGLEKKILVEEVDDDGNVVVVEKDVTSVSAGDDVTFQLTSNVPTDLTNYLEPDNADDPEADEDSTVAEESAISLMSLADFDGYDSAANGGQYNLTFHDEMDSALIFNEDSVTVTLVIYEQDENGDPVYDENGVRQVKGDPITLSLDTNDYQVLTDCDDGCTFEITMDLVDLYKKGYFTDDDFGCVDIIVTYTATASETIEAGEHLNTSAVEYEGNSTEEDTVVVYTYGVRIFKFDQSSGEIKVYEVDTYELNDDNEIESVTIDGETYPVSIADDGSMTITIGSTICEISVDTNDDGTITNCYYTDNVTGEEMTGLAGAEFILYRVATDDDTDTTPLQVGEDEITCVIVTTLTSDDDGYAVYEGLAAGTYYLVETKAPSGYVMSTTPLTVTILEGKKTDYILDTLFANAPIPSTGGTGTRMYLIGGVCIILAAGVMLILSRRKKDTEQ